MQICSMIVLQHILIMSTFIFKSKDIYWQIFASLSPPRFYKKIVIENSKLKIAIMN